MVYQESKPSRSYLPRFTVPAERLMQRKASAKKGVHKHQESSRIASLPYDILFVIIVSLDEASQVRMIQSCRYFRSLVEPFLYRHIRVFPNPGEGRNPLRGHLIHDTLVARRDLLPCVLSYHGPLVPGDAVVEPTIQDDATSATSRLRTAHSPSSRVISSNERFQIAKIIFSGAVNMKDLHLTDWVNSWSQRLWNTLGTTQSNRSIKKLALNVIGEPSYMISILRQEPGLEHLVIRRSGGTAVHGLRATDLPELRSLTATLSEAADVVPGRPVRTLELLHYHLENNAAEVFFKKLTLSAGHITDLTIRFARPWNYEATRTALQLVARFLPRVERLCLSLASTVSQSLLLEELSAFIYLQHLRLIDQFGNSICDDILQDNRLQDDSSIYCQQGFTHFSQGLKERCPGLTEVEWCRGEMFSCCEDRSVVAFRYDSVE